MKNYVILIVSLFATAAFAEKQNQVVLNDCRPYYEKTLLEYQSALEKDFPAQKDLNVLTNLILNFTDKMHLRGGIKGLKTLLAVLDGDNKAEKKMFRETLRYADRRWYTEGFESVDPEQFGKSIRTLSQRGLLCNLTAWDLNFFHYDFPHIYKKVLFLGFQTRAVIGLEGDPLEAKLAEIKDRIGIWERLTGTKIY